MNKRSFKVLAVYFLALFAISDQVVFSLPLRDPSKLEKASKETAVRVSTAKVLLCDYELLKKDFDELKDLTNKQIDQWLIDSAAYISTAQTGKNEVNTAITVNSNDSRIVYRPETYGRASVIEAGSGLLDVKGTGVAYGKVPKNQSHANGLLSLGEAIREFTMQHMVEGIFSHSTKAIGYKPKSGQRLTTVKSYAVIDWGFDIYDTYSKFKGSNNGLMRAGAVVRQAHARKPQSKGNTFLSAEEADETEDLLRNYGVTFSGNVTPDIDFPDIQADKNGAIVDFGTCIVMDRFSKERRTPLGCPDQYKSDHDYPDIQPQQEICIPFEIWGHDRSYNPEGKSNCDRMRHFGEIMAHQINCRGLQGDLRDVVERYTKGVLGGLGIKWLKNREKKITLQVGSNADLSRKRELDRNKDVKLDAEDDEDVENTEKTMPCVIL